MTLVDRLYRLLFPRRYRKKFLKDHPPEYLVKLRKQALLD
jgi:hypothetical protein